MHKKKLAFISSSLSGGGAERNMLNISLYLNRKHLNTDIFIYKNKNDYSKEYKSDLNKLNIVSLFNLPSFLLLPLSPFIFIRLYLYIYKEKYDVIVAAHEYFSFYLSILVAKATGKKSVLLIGNNIEQDIKTKPFILKLIHLLTCRLILRKADKIIAVSKGLSRNIQTFFFVPRSKIEVIYNGIDIQRIKKLLKINRLHKQHKKNKTSLITAGRLVKQKGINHLIRILPAITKFLPNIELTIMGKGRMALELKKLMQSLKLEHSVKFIGFAKDNPYTTLKNSDLFVLPSLYEGFGNILVEAMTCGLPVISTDCLYGPREILDDNSSYENIVKKPYFGKYGILIPNFKPGTDNSKNESSIVKTMVALLKNKKMLNHYKKMSLKRAQDFTVEKMGQKYYKLLKQLTK